MTYVDELKRLFINRLDAYEIQQRYGRWRAVHEPLTSLQVLNHVAGMITIGVFSIGEDGRVKWLCWDFDIHHYEGSHPKNDILLMQSKLKEWYGLDSYIEKSGSHNSYHLWIFINPADKQVALNFNYRFRERLKELGIDNRKVEKGAQGGTYGCNIRLPLGVNQKHGNRSTFFSDVNLEQIQPQELPELEPIPVPPTNCAEQSDSLIDVEVCKQLIELDTYLYDHYLEDKVDDRSGKDYLICKYLIYHGVSAETIYEFLLTIKWSKVRLRGREYFDRTYERAINADPWVVSI